MRASIADAQADAREERFASVVAKEAASARGPAWGSSAAATAMETARADFAAGAEGLFPPPPTDDGMRSPSAPPH
eukprot:gene4313-7556_t